MDPSPQSTPSMPSTCTQSDPPKRRGPTYIRHDLVENLDCYAAGGYHPTHLGDIFHARYKVIHKLGWGSFSVVWLARDLQENRNVALKILTANSSQASSEAKILRALNHGNKERLGYQFIAHLLDEFQFDGPNGRHQCLVLKVSGTSVAESQDGIHPFPLDVARSISAQAILGLEYIHSCGVVHGGEFKSNENFYQVSELIVVVDLHSRNILLNRPGLEYFTEAEVVEHLEEPERLEVTRHDGQPHGPEAPDYCVTPAFMGMRAEDVPANLTIVISDFSHSFFTTDRCESLSTPLRLVPPEQLFKGALGPAADVWTLAMTVYSILSTRPLVDGWEPSAGRIIAEWIDALGPPPEDWWERRSDREDVFGAANSWTGSDKRPLITRIGRMEREDEMGDDERKSLERLFQGARAGYEDLELSGMLEYKPSERVETRDVVFTDWVLQYAMPNFMKQHDPGVKFPTPFRPGLRGGASPREQEAASQTYRSKSEEPRPRLRGGATPKEQEAAFRGERRGSQKPGRTARQQAAIDALWEQIDGFQLRPYSRGNAAEAATDGSTRNEDDGARSDTDSTRLPPSSSRRPSDHTTPHLYATCAPQSASPVVVDAETDTQRVGGGEGSDTRWTAEAECGMGWWREGIIIGVIGFGIGIGIGVGIDMA